MRNFGDLRPDEREALSRGQTNKWRTGQKQTKEIKEPRKVSPLPDKTISVSSEGTTV